MVAALRRPWAENEIPASATTVPAVLPGVKEQTLAYQAAMRDLCDRVLAFSRLSLELP